MKTTIGEISDIQIGYQTKGRIKEEPESHWRILQLKDFSGDVRAPDWSMLMPIKPERKAERYSVNEGDVLFACRGPRNVVFHVEQTNEKVLATNAFYILRPNLNVILPEYLAWWLSLDTNQEKIEMIRTMGVMPLVPKADLAKFEIQIPNMEAQANIVRTWELATKEHLLTKELSEQKLQLAQLICKQSATNVITGRMRKEPANGPTPMLVYEYEYAGMPIEELHNEQNFYIFKLTEIPIEITVRLYQQQRGGAIWFTQSHWIKTPEQISPYRTSRPFNDDEPAALRQAITGFTQFYEQAVQAGHQADATWLIENPDFAY